MGKNIASVLVFGAFVISAWGETAFGQPNQMKVLTPEQQSIKAMQAKLMAIYRPDIFPEIHDGGYKDIMQSVIADKTTGELWLVAMRHKPQDNLSKSQIGFLSSTLKNTGNVEWPGVTISATIQVHNCQGPLTFMVTMDQGNSYGLC